MNYYTAALSSKTLFPVRKIKGEISRLITVEIVLDRTLSVVLYLLIK